MDNDIIFMGCNCKRKQEEILREKRAQDLIDGKAQTVSLEVLNNRRNQCRQCPKSTKNSHPKFAAFGGLTSVSKCSIANRLILECLKDPKFVCPMGKF